MTYKFHSRSTTLYIKCSWKGFFPFFPLKLYWANTWFDATLFRIALTVSRHVQPPKAARNKACKKDKSKLCNMFISIRLHLIKHLAFIYYFTMFIYIENKKMKKSVSHCCLNQDLIISQRSEDPRRYRSRVDGKVIWT